VEVVRPESADDSRELALQGSRPLPPGCSPRISVLIVCSAPRVVDGQEVVITLDAMAPSRRSSSSAMKQHALPGPDRKFTSSVA
jgi:hypothetical protein